MRTLRVGSPFGAYSFPPRVHIFSVAGMALATACLAARHKLLSWARCNFSQASRADCLWPRVSGGGAETSSSYWPSTAFQKTLSQPSSGSHSVKLGPRSC